MENLKHRLHSAILVFLLASMLVATSFGVVFPSQPEIVQAAETELRLNITEATLIKGQRLTLKLTETKKTVTFSSSDPKVAKVDSSGKVTACSKGTAVITAASGDREASCTIQVESPYLTQKSVRLNFGETLKIRIKGTTLPYSFGSEDTKVATISKWGTITPKSVGSTRVYAKIGSKKFYCTVDVSGTGLHPDELREYAETKDYVSDAAIEEVIRIAGEMITEEMCETEKIKAVHDYLINHTVYATGELEEWDMNFYSTMPAQEYQKLDDAYGFIFHPDGVLFEGRAVCQGYMETIELFMKYLGIESMEITGIAEQGSHAWNLVKLSDGWYHLDATFDDPVSDDGTDSLQYSYFLLNDTLMRRNHTWKEDEYPACTGTDYLMYGYRDYLVTTQEEAIERILEQLTSKSGTTAANVVFKEEACNISEIGYAVMKSTKSPVNYEYYETTPGYIMLEIRISK